MYRVAIRFYEELNDFLRPSHRKRELDFEFGGRRSVKDLIESFGVPHVEVDLILVNGRSVDFSYIVADGDRLSVYPVFESLDIGSVTRLRPSPLRDPRFVLDVHLQKLARRLRLMGFDVDYLPDRDDAALAETADREGRILLSRDRQLMMRKRVARGLYVRNTDPDRQVAEILDRLQLRGLCRPFTRCIECNQTIEELDAAGPDFAALEKTIPPGVRSWCREYYRCLGCGRIYWKGSHYEKLKKRVEMILDGR
ncbi:MAG: Mut7-C ubiquitin/RNAse domain-containing protein [Spirochaetes bacterium]|nr:Mut7-C ubiquitin/RNAse domain-containing protein [Spirochaetota bacterium]